jgi:hypothetical protein
MFEALPLTNNRVVCKVKKEQHQNPEFGPRLGERLKKKKPAQKYISIQEGGLKPQKWNPFWW